MRIADLYTPPVLGGVALFDNSASGVYKIQSPWGTSNVYALLALTGQKGCVDMTSPVEFPYDNAPKVDSSRDCSQRDTIEAEIIA